jgi:hypothetical protein
LAFYDISGAGMHLGELEKRQVWPSSDMPLNRPPAGVKVPRAAGLQSAPGRISSANWKIVVLF